MTFTYIDFEHAQSERIDYEWVWLIGMADKKSTICSARDPVSNAKKLRKVSFSLLSIFRRNLQLPSMPKRLELAIFVASTTTTTDGHNRSLYPCCACVCEVKHFPTELPQ